MELSDEEHQKFRSVFDQFDLNGDGVLSHEELKSALEGIGYHLSQHDFQVNIDVNM